MVDTPYTQGFRAGQANERERIIKLLEEAKTWLEDYDVDELIGQIKEEQNGH